MLESQQRDLTTICSSGHTPSWSFSMDFHDVPPRPSCILPRIASDSFINSLVLSDLLPQAHRTCCSRIVVHPSNSSMIITYSLVWFVYVCCPRIRYRSLQMPSTALQDWPQTYSPDLPGYWNRLTTFGQSSVLASDFCHLLRRSCTSLFSYGMDTILCLKSHEH